VLKYDIMSKYQLFNLFSKKTQKAKLASNTLKKSIIYATSQWSL